MLKRKKRRKRHVIFIEEENKINRKKDSTRKFMHCSLSGFLNNISLELIYCVQIYIFPSQLSHVQSDIQQPPRHFSFYTVHLKFHILNLSSGNN